jgi:hypothetical protein
MAVNEVMSLVCVEPELEEKYLYLNFSYFFK